jgi:hypothetical protein
MKEAIDAHEECRSAVRDLIQAGMKAATSGSTAVASTTGR